MILEAIFKPFFIFSNYIIDAIPILEVVPLSLIHTIDLISKPLSIFPKNLWIVLLINIIGWLIIDFAWVIIEWIYKKIPGVD